MCARVVLVAQLVLSAVATAQSVSELTRLTASDAMPGASFAHSLALDGDTAIVGADHQNNFTGGAYIFERDAGGPDHWGEVTKLLPPDVLPGHFFGYRVALSGDSAAVGATRRTSSGAVYVFERNAGGPQQWGQTAFLTPQDGDGATTFGTGMGLDAGTLVVGANHASSMRGAAWVFERQGSWQEVAKLLASDGQPGDEFGQIVDIHQDTIIVGSIFDDDLGIDAGSAYVFERDLGGSEAWGEAAKIVAPDGAPGDHFGISVAVWNDTIAVGADFNDESSMDAGAVYVYQRVAGGSDNWVFVQKLTAQDAQLGDHFGGVHIDLSDDLLLVGALRADAAGLDSGAAYLFARDPGQPSHWGQRAKLLAADTAAGHLFGETVAISGKTLLVGGTGHDHTGPRSGAAYTFSANASPLPLCQDVVSTASTACRALVSPQEVDAGSSDPDGDPLVLHLVPAPPYPLGLTLVELVATDPAGASARCDAVIDVQDTTAPAISALDASPAVLWPPNHRIVAVHVAATVSDNCDTAPSCAITNVSSNEPINGTGDGNTEPDWEIVSSTVVNLRAERTGHGGGRVYQVTVTCSDTAANHSTATVAVSVPKSRGRR